MARIVCSFYLQPGQFIHALADLDDFALPGPKHASWATKIALRAKQIALPFTSKSTADLKKYVAHRYATIPVSPTCAAAVKLMSLAADYAFEPLLRIFARRYA